METAIVSIICIALVVFGGMTMSQGLMTSVDASTSGFEDIGRVNEDIMRTEFTPVTVSLPALDTLEITLENTGQTKITDFDKWDVIVQYYDGISNYHVEWLPYIEGTPGNNEWEVVWIRLDGEDEVFEPNVFNPGEQILLRAKVSPAIGSDTTNMVIVATPAGITASTYFSP